MELLHISVMEAVLSCLCPDEVGHSVFPDMVSVVKVLENACKDMRNVLIYKEERILRLEDMLRWNLVGINHY